MKKLSFKRFWCGLIFKTVNSEIKDTEKKTNGKVTYLGTWHSHPYGGKASQIDNRTYGKLLFVRNYEPTVCLIITHHDVIMV